MPEPRPSLSLLNVYEVERDGRIHHLLGFIDPVLAGARGMGKDKSKDKAHKKEPKKEKGKN